MATKILAHPVDDKRKASVVSTVYDASAWDVVDIRGFANFTIIVSATLSGAASIYVCDASDGTFIPLRTLGTTNDGTLLGTMPVTAGIAYDVPELAGCHYLTFNGPTSGTIKVMGKV